MQHPAITRLVKATGFSCAGLRATFCNEAAFRQEVVLFALLSPASLFIRVGAAGHALLIGSLFLVLIVEVVNSAIEACINRISADIHPLSRAAKDGGNAAVMLALLNAACVWIIVLCA